MRKVPKLTSGAHTIAILNKLAYQDARTLYFYLDEGVIRSGGESTFKALSRGYVHWVSG